MSGVYLFKCVCDRARYHFILTLTLEFFPPSLSFSFVCQRLRAFRYSINNNSVNLFFPPQRLTHCMCVYVRVCVRQNRFNGSGGDDDGERMTNK